ncbi:transcriptional regulator [Nocardia lijiangensis]|uniref:MmyB family transcriptional regulator n=1 Tax=Nocardia lijiangensis TaxID=299618 RepID=UPI0027D8B602|nr:transcriptional regulator [Nocardia lijiangensis]
MANLARFVFADPRARLVYPDWDDVADQRVAMLKHGPFRADPAIAHLTDELTVIAGDEFTRRVESVPSLPAATGITRLAHPTAGPLRLAYETLDLSADDDQQLIVHLPADEATAAALDVLAGRCPGQLRAVSG